MKTTINVFPGLIAASALVFGLSACSSSPAPWTRPDESPWSSKYAEQEKAVAEDVAVVDAPVVIEEPAPEPVMVTEPEPVAVAPVVIAEPEPETPEQRVLNAAAGGYAVQALAGTKASVVKHRDDKGLDDMLAVKTERSGSIIYVLVSLHGDRASANEAAADVESKTGSKPWVRSVESLQKVVAP